MPDLTIVKFVVRPYDLSDVEIDNTTSFKCKSCQRNYPLVDGIPIMLQDGIREIASSRTK